MSTGLTTVSAVNLCDSSGALIANATIYFKPVLESGAPTSYQVGASGGGTVVVKAVKTQVSNGAFSLPLADALLTTPAIGYSVRLVDNATGDELLAGTAYNFVQPTGAAWSFDTFTTVSGASYSTAIVFADVGNGNRYSLSIASGARQESLVSSSTPLTTTPTVLIDDVTGTHYQLQFAAGAFQWAGVSSSVAGVAALNLSDTVTGASWALTIASGALTMTLLAAASYPAALVFADIANGSRYSLSIASGARQESLVLSSTPLTTTPTVLIDTVTGTHFQLQFNGGAFQWFPVASTVAGLVAINLTDTATGGHWALTIASGALTETAIA